MEKKAKRLNIGLFISMLENEFSYSIMEGVSLAAKDLDADFTVFPIGLINADYTDKKSNNFRYQYNILASFLQKSSIDVAVIEYGTIVSNLDNVRKKRILSYIGDIPVILLSEEADGFPSMCVNNRTGLEEIINHFIDDHGCSKIGFISGPKNNQDAIERLNVYKDVLTSRNMYLGDDWIGYGNFSIYSEKVVTELINRHPDIEAIVFANDHMALGAYPVIENMGKIIGKDILISGFDNIPSSILAEPQLTTVVSDTKQMAYDAVLHLINGIERDAKYLHNTRMVSRGSCGCMSRHTTNISDFTNPDAKATFAINSQDTNLEDMREATKDKVEEAIMLRTFEVELNNISREMIYSHDSDLAWFNSILHSLRKLNFNSCYVLLYETPSENKKENRFNLPPKVYLRGSLIGKESQIYDNYEKEIDTYKLFDYEIFTRDYSRSLVLIPLFFRENQYGYILVESRMDYFQFASQLANNISSTLEIEHILRVQEKIKQELAYANQSKSQFLANMSHEIRTPINAIMGMNEMILRENKDPQIDKYATDVKNAASALLGLVNDILDFSKIEAGKMPLIMGNYDLKDLLRDTMKLTRARMKDKNLSLSLEYDDTLPSILYGDEGRIKQILLNLLSNAVKYTNEGSVTLNMSGFSDKSYAHITFSVTDTGIGIKKEDIGKLFEKFERLEEKRNRNIEGTGLGMSITIGLLQLMGSSLNVESVYNEGSTFSFTLIQKIADNTPIGKYDIENIYTPKEKYIQKYTAENAKILVVDDIEINRVIIESLLKQSLIHFDQADNGQACIDKYQKDDYDMILLDHMMPVMDGLETMRIISELPKYKKHPIPVIALTANAVSGAKEMYLEAGFTNYLSKPVNQAELDDILLKHLPLDKVSIIYSEDKQ